ncbi:hypothetical protein FRC07_000172 [Ceratobasidium sp. 392]|nr:hypothetical protein FRC07_000172 [Ceratobasidium sp. 392]
MSLWELRDSVFAKAFAHSNFAEESKSILLFPLGTEDGHTRVNFGMTFNEFTMDLHQDLIVMASVDPDQFVVSCIICDLLLTITQPEACEDPLMLVKTGRAHPQAKHHSLFIKLGFKVLAGVAFSITLEIKDNLVAAKFEYAQHHAYEILIWDWKTCRLLNRISCDNGICNFVFLDHNRLILWAAYSTGEHDDLNSVNLLVYEQIGSASLGQGVFESRTFDVSSFPKLNPTFTFQFPKFQDDSLVSIAGFLLRSDYGSGASVAASMLFANSKALTLGLTMTMEISGYIRPLRIFVDTCQLIDHLERPREKPISKLSWEEWGEHATRWFQLYEPTHWICWMFGSRFIFADRHISVVDFHTPTVRRHANRQRDTYVSLERPQDALMERKREINMGRLLSLSNEQDTGAGEPAGPSDDLFNESPVVVDCVTSQEPTSLSYFGEPVISRLPYRMVTKVHPAPPHEGWLISGNQLIGMGYDFDFASSLNELTVYTIGSPTKTATDA